MFGPAFTAASISQDITKPIVATAAFEAGTVIFHEEAFVSSSFGNMDMDNCCDEDCEDDDCGGCAEVEEEDEPESLDEDDLEAVSPAVIENFDKLMEFAETKEPLNMVDIRKNLFKCFHLVEADAGALAPLYALSVNADESANFLDAAVDLRAQFPSVVPSCMTDDNVAHVIGVLNKHCHALEEINGSGLFLYVSKLPHACLPNCNITVSGTSMWVTAIKPIAVGETLTLDILDLFYSPISDRRETLAEDKMECTCASCTGAIPDFARAFKCKAGSCAGIVHPTNGAFVCTTCNYTFSADETADVEMHEIADVDEIGDVETLTELDGVIAASPLHKYHYVFYLAIEALSSVSMDDDELPETEAAKIYNRVLECLNYVVPYPHDLKTQHYDHLAQTLIGAGDINGATEAYEKAYEMSCLCSGKDFEESVLYKKLAENTPTNREEMMAAYGIEVDEDDE
ncbi:hypothetical protein SPRG_04387 [Saprolegnia parasitica CBS 223.65]|uniref:SET domain-containing protein n=1 Tax=Saprolegnia parasitica (strain CBS 223.65) TaxID=695850 RepID=A0A067CIB2_SAPPC|nr:hypothetical protein SPRG_04387 [Saprolegnia parasitica CBS 223.65]KDO30484.1 hypothetical protein SPRG_04387 [Saprolegnia parasitica CBS 223.65]|eukprot:XP_012198706.1 hypothetical protein SPRG_04387 [Saprolegnia parasitica CBS 223.65]